MRRRRFCAAWTSCCCNATHLIVVSNEVFQRRGGLLRAIRTRYLLRAGRRQQRCGGAGRPRGAALSAASPSMYKGSERSVTCFADDLRWRLPCFPPCPMPQFDWNERNMRYALCAFPLVGAVCGALWCVCGVLPLPAVCSARRASALCRSAVTGGIHLDGYADTSRRAFKLRRHREKKLEIFKGPPLRRVRGHPAVQLLCGVFCAVRLCARSPRGSACSGRWRWCGSGRCPGWPWRRSRWRKTPALPTPLPRRRTASACGSVLAVLCAHAWPRG